MLKDPFVQRLVITGLAIGCTVGAFLIPVPHAESAFLALAAGLTAWAHAPRPGDVTS